MGLGLSVVNEQNVSKMCILVNSDVDAVTTILRGQNYLSLLMAYTPLVQSSLSRDISETMMHCQDSLTNINFKRTFI